MFYIILIILIALIYLFLMPKDVRRSMDIFFFSAAIVIVVSLAVAQAFDNETILIELLLIALIIGATIRSIIEIGRL